MVLRPDEEAAQEEIRRDQKFRQNIQKSVKTAGTLTGVGIAGALSSKIAPFLSQYIPTDLAMKGINKVSPKLGEFLRKGQAMGLDVREGIDFIKNKITPKEINKPIENRNIIEQYSPELFQFINNEIQKGKSPLEAGELALNQENFIKIIQKIMADHKAPFSSILKTVFGGSDLAQTNGQTQKQQQGGISDEQLLAAFQNILSM